VLGQSGSIPYCDTYPNYYCWVVAMPKCLKRVGLCLEACPESPCCLQQWRLCINRATGLIVPILIKDCNNSLPCPTNPPCGEDVGCDFVPGSCPACP